MPVFALSDVSPKEKPASDIFDLTDDSDFELDIRVTSISGEKSSAAVDIATTTLKTNGCTSDTCICSYSCTCPGYYSCYGTCTAPGNGC